MGTLVINRQQQQQQSVGGGGNNDNAVYERLNMAMSMLVSIQIQRHPIRPCAVARWPRGDHGEVRLVPLAERAACVTHVPYVGVSARVFPQFSLALPQR